MKNTEIILTRSMLTDLDGITSLIIACNNSAEDVKLACSLISDALLLNVMKLNLDEGIMNLMRFAVGIAVEISPLLSSIHENFNENHWEWKPVMIKVAGKDRPWSDVRPQEKQAACMVDVLMNQLKRDAIFRAGATAIEGYQLQAGIWASSEFPDIEE